MGLYNVSAGTPRHFSLYHFFLSPPPHLLPLICSARRRGRETRSEMYPGARYTRARAPRIHTYFLIIPTFFLRGRAEARARLFASRTLFQFSPAPRRFVYRRDKATYTFVANVAIESPPVTKATGYADRVISFLGRENEGFLTHFTRRAGLTRSPCRRYFVDHQGRAPRARALHAKRKCAADCFRIRHPPSCAILPLSLSLFSLLLFFPSYLRPVRNYIVVLRDAAPNFPSINHFLGIEIVRRACSRILSRLSDVIARMYLIINLLYGLLYDRELAQSVRVWGVSP